MERGEKNCTTHQSLLCNSASSALPCNGRTQDPSSLSNYWVKGVSPHHLMYPWKNLSFGWRRGSAVQYLPGGVLHPQHRKEISFDLPLPNATAARLQGKLRRKPHSHQLWDRGLWLPNPAKRDIWLQRWRPKGLESSSQHGKEDNTLLWTSAGWLEHWCVFQRQEFPRVPGVMWYTWIPKQFPSITAEVELRGL
jgi:hypothetical protein